VIDDHGGTITVNSREGSGTTFSIKLPVDGRKDELEENPEE